MEQKNSNVELSQERKDEAKWVTEQMEKMPESVRNSLSFFFKPGKHHPGVFRGRMTERAMHMMGQKGIVLPYQVREMGSQKFAKLVKTAVAG